MRICFVLLVFFSVLNVASQELAFHSYQVEDGLSHNSVISMLQDHRGFMWFGTKDGLNRFDGYNYKIFRHDSSDLHSLGSNFIRCLHEWKDAIWVGTDTGLFRYDEKMESFRLIASTKDQPILDIDHDTNGNLWFSAAGNLHKISLITSEEEVYKQDYFSFISLNKSGEIYVASSSTLYKYTEDTNSFQTININYDNAIIITQIAADVSKGSILIGTKNNGALRYTISDGKCTSLLSKKDRTLFVRDFLRKSDNELWIASESGLFIYELTTGQYQHYVKNYNDPYSLSDNAVYSLVLDKEEGVWIGTYFGGANYLPKQYTPIKKYFPKVGENSISGNAIREIKKDNYGDLWIGTEDAGLNKLNLSTDTFVNYPSLKNNGNLSHYNIHGLLPRGDDLWIGTFEHGLDVMNIKTGKVIKHYGTGEKEGGLRSDFILYIYETRIGDVYVLTSSGIHKYLEDTDSFQVVTAFPEIYHYTFLAEDINGILWAGTYWDGLYYYDPKTGKKGFFKHSGDDATSISSNVINGIFQDSKNRLWITTENGLNLYNPKQNNFKRITKKDGLPSNVTYSILEDKNKNLWITTSRGLLKFNPETEEKQIFTKSNGLLSDQFNYSSFFKDDTGELYFGSVNGLISFNPESFIENTYNPPVYITDIQINNKEVKVGNEQSPLEKSISFTQNLLLHSKQSTFRLEFSTLSYTAPLMTNYWYKMEGLNDQWIKSENNQIAFTEMPPGDYTFKIKALNSSGVWSKNTSRLSIEVLPPLLASTTAYMLYIFILLLFVFLGIRYYHTYTKNKNSLRIQHLQNQKEKEIYNAKIEFFTNVAHEIRTPLTLIRSPLEKLLKNKYKSPEIPKNLGIMEKNTSRLLNLVNELLDFRKTEIQNIKLTFIQININALLEETHIRFSQMIQEKGLNFNSFLPDETILASVDEEAIRKILSNLYSNAIKYSKKKVAISLIKEEQYFKIIIKNDGQLIPIELRKKIFEPFYRVPGDSKNPGTGIGLSLAHSLTELHQGKLSFSLQDQMNTFILYLPLHQSEEFINLPKKSTPDSILKKTLPADFNKNAPVILVAEDNIELANFIFSELSETYNVIVAINGEDAWNCLLNTDIHLVISDVMMPIKDGIALCRQIKEDDLTNHIPVILLTAKNALTATIEGLEAGADAYISKPFSMDHLQVQISNLLGNRRTILGHYSNSPLAHLKSLALSESDQDFLSVLDKTIEENLKDPDLNVESLAELMNMSRSTLYRKIKEISKLSPKELINVSRLKKAAYLLKTTNDKIFEISEQVGYRSQTSFGRNFQKKFDITPSDFKNDKSDHTVI